MANQRTRHGDPPPESAITAEPPPPIPEAPAFDPANAVPTAEPVPNGDLALALEVIKALRQADQQTRSVSDMVAAVLSGRSATELVADQAERERFAAWAALSAQEKSQLQADKTFAADTASGMPRWRCQLVRVPTRGDLKGQRSSEGLPELVLPASSPNDARARYAKLCGLRRFTEEESTPDQLGRVPPLVVGDQSAAPRLVRISTRGA